MNKPITLTSEGLNIISRSMRNHVMDGGKLYEIERGKWKSSVSTTVTGIDGIISNVPSRCVIAEG